MVFYKHFHQSLSAVCSLPRLSAARFDTLKTPGDDAGPQDYRKLMEAISTEALREGYAAAAWARAASRAALKSSSLLSASSALAASRARAASNSSARFSSRFSRASSCPGLCSSRLS